MLANDRALKAISYRILSLKVAIAVLEKEGDKHPDTLEDLKSRLDELDNLFSFIADPQSESI